LDSIRYFGTRVLTLTTSSWFAIKTRAEHDAQARTNSGKARKDGSTSISKFNADLFSGEREYSPPLWLLR